MHKFYFVLLLLSTHFVSAAGQTVSIQQPFVDTQLCEGTTLAVSYVTSSSFNPGNTFTIELSDATGSFAAPTPIGMIPDITSGTINCTIPGGLPSSLSYRIRIVASSPVYMSPDNGKNIQIEHAPPAPLLSNNSPVCENDSLGLKINNTVPGAIYTWTGPGLPGQQVAVAFSFKNASLSLNGLYHITADVFGCTSDAQVYVTIKPLPQKPTAGSDITACSGDTIQLHVLPNSSIPGFSWTGPGGFTAAGQNPVIENISTLQAGQYLVRGVDNGCLSALADTLNVEVIRRPQLTIHTNSPVCAGDSLRLSASDTGLISYEWKGPGGFQSINPVVTIPDLSDGNTGTYYITASHFGCTTRDSVTAALKPMPPPVVLSAPSPICTGDSLYINTVTTQAPGTVFYTWTGPNNYQADGLFTLIKQVQQAHAGDYVLTEELDGCKHHDTLHIDIKPRPVVTATSNAPVDAEQKLTLFASSDIPGTNYAWHGPANFSSAEQNPEIGYATEENEGVYTVTATTGDCSGTDTIDIKIYDPINYTLFRILPNPNSGNFTLKGRVRSAQTVQIAIYDAESGIRIYTGSAKSNGKLVEKKINLGHYLRTGIYLVRIKTIEENITLRLSLVQ